MAAFAARIDSVHPAPSDGAGFGGGGRKRNEVAVVVAVVGKCDQALVPTPVMPGKAVLRHSRRDALIEDALEILLGVIFPWGASSIKEAGRGHLARIASDYHLFAPCDRSHGVPWGNLRSLVEYDQIKEFLVRREVLSDGQRTHQHARRESGESFSHLLGKLPHRLMPALLLQLSLEDPVTPAHGGVILVRNLPADPGANVVGGKCSQLVYGGCVAVDVALVGGWKET